MTSLEPAWTNWAVLAYGPRKAGTTLFQNLLDGSDAMLVYPAELKLKYFVKHRPPDRELAAAYHRESRIPEISSAHLSIARYLDYWKNEPTPADLADFIRRDAWNVFRSCSRPPAEPRLWCVKEVGGDTDAIIALWREMFPKGRLLFIVRDPLMVTRAILNDRRRKGRRLSLFGVAREAWDSLRVTRAQQRHLNDPDVFAIAYEDLVADPASVMARVVSFLGLESNAIFTQPTMFQESVVVRTASQKLRSVFVPETDWRDGLSSHEQLVVSFTMTFAMLLGRSVDYPSMRRQVSTKV